MTASLPAEVQAVFDCFITTDLEANRGRYARGFHATPGGVASGWHPRIGELGERYRTAVLSIVSPDGFPFSVRVPVSIERANAAKARGFHRNAKREPARRS